MMFLATSFNAEARTLYLNTGGTALWENNGADKFAVWHWKDGSNGTFTPWMTRVEGSLWQVTLSDESDRVIFCRFATTATQPDWNQKWHQTEDLIVTEGLDLFTITSMGEGDKSVGVWSTYGEEPPEPIDPTDYDKAVPAECMDVMLQAFYWESYQDKGYGNTKWETLTGQVGEIGKTFTLVWLPPSAEASGMGYIPTSYSSQACVMGKRSALEALISSLHNAGTRVLADIVINHCGNKSNWCDYRTMNFGEYGSFSPESSWVTRDDEGNCNQTANLDDGQHEANYGAARDWDHKNTNVQNMCKAYLKWMKNVMRYDGYRFDYCGGYHTGHINDYVSAAKPYFSVMEYWDGNAANLKARINDAQKNTLTFDFSNMYNAIRDGIAKGSYTKCKNAGLRGLGYSKYAVTFIDNHDTFARGGNTTDILGKNDGSSINNQKVMLQANAYILSLPGVPCVFYPHWVKYKTEIKKMVLARRSAGIHSESQMTETAGNGYYEATIDGKYGQVILYLGSSATKAQPEGFLLASKGDGYAMYYSTTHPIVDDAIDDVSTAQPALNWSEPVYNLMGQLVDENYRGIVIQNGHKFLNEPY